MKPIQKTNNPAFSSGPCSKFPGWSLAKLNNFKPGRSHRASSEKAKLKSVIDQTKELLEIPDDYLVGILPASDTGAFEAAMWNVLGERPVDVLVWESFSNGWASDIKNQLKLENINILKAEYGQLPDLAATNKDHDQVFVFNGTTSGVKLPNCDWIESDRTGLTLCDATSAVFAMNMDWSKLDITTFSWQKVMGSEAGHGMIVLSPRAVARLESYTPAWPLPKIFRLTKGGKIMLDIFSGSTINTPSMLAVEDALIALDWIRELGDYKGTIARSEANLNVIKDWVSESSWIEFLAESKETISNTSICLKITANNYKNLDSDSQKKFAKDICKLLADEEVAFDIASYKDAPPGIRIWGGATIESSDIKILTEWLDWAYNEISTQYNVTTSQSA
ncbi:MAG: phosphoserine transaminase [Rickettsiales bacterium]|jgi:phosphoserine aminotransferase|nr:phosphoserine transaminase [Rickettsiales bacterium]